MYEYLGLHEILLGTVSLTFLANSDYSEALRGAQGLKRQGVVDEPIHVKGLA